MTTTGFAQSLPHVLVYEGGEVDDPKDPGGRTNEGITQRTYDAYRSLKGLSKQDVYLMVPAERDQIYHDQYWIAVRGDDLPAGVDFAVFDGGVNSGPGESIQWLQRALGPLYTGRIDGIFGMATLAAVKAVNDNDGLIDRMEAERLAFLKALPTWGRFGNGWKSRIDQVVHTSQAWASGSVGPAPVFHDGGNVKAPSAPSPVAPKPETPPASGLLALVLEFFAALAALFKRNPK